MTFTVFLLENSFHTLPPIQFHLLVMDTENSLWGKKQTTSWKKREREVIRYTGSKTTEKHTFFPSAPWATVRRLMAKLLIPSRKLVWGSPKLLTWLLGILNPGFYFCWAGLGEDRACCPLLWVLHLGHGEVRHCSNRPLQVSAFSAFKFPSRVSLPPSTLRSHSLGRQWLGIGKYWTHVIATPREWGAGRHAFRRVYHSLKRLKHSTPCLLLLTCRTPIVWAVSPGSRKLKPWRCSSGAVHRVSPTCFLYLIYCYPLTSHEKDERIISFTNYPL